MRSYLARAMARRRQHLGMKEWNFNIPLPKGGISAPEAYGQANHEECMGAEVRRNRKVAIEARGSHLDLHPGEVGRLPSNEGDHLLAQVVSPFWEGSLVCGH